MPTLDTSKIELFGAAAVSIGGVDVGHTDETGVKLALTNTIVEAISGKYGQSPVAAFLNGQRGEIEFVLIQTEFDNLERVLPGATKVTDAGNSKLTFGKAAGGKLTGVELIFTPVLSGQSPKYNLTVPVAVPIGDFELVYSGESHNKWTCKFLVLINEAGGVEGNYMFTFGDASITGDAVAPTATVVPADDATGIAIGTTVVWTCSENLDGNTVDLDSVLLIEDPLGAGGGTKVAGGVVLVNAGASTTITLTPDSNLAASTDYAAMLNSSIKDLNGNPFVPMITNFQTA